MSKNRILLASLLVCLFGFMQGIVVTHYNHKRKMNDTHKILIENESLNKQEVVRLIQTEGYQAAREYVNEIQDTYDSIYNY